VELTLTDLSYNKSLRVTSSLSSPPEGELSENTGLVSVCSVMGEEEKTRLCVEPWLAKEDMTCG
jgi:hypothetical protein